MGEKPLKPDKVLHCSFCGKTQHEVKKLIAGPNAVFICDECIGLCNDIILDETPKATGATSGKPILTPEEIVARLSLDVIGQLQAKMRVARAVYSHYFRMEQAEKANPDDVLVEKVNILLIGPTGSGKTHIAKMVAKLVGVPFAIADANTLTEAGYVGDDVETMLTKLLQNCEYDVKKAEYGIIYIDEADKLARKAESAHHKDPSGEGVQNALLKLIEGTVASVPPSGGRKLPNQDFVQIDTTNILFILGGSFAGIEKIVAARSATSTGIGFGADVRIKGGGTRLGELLRQVEPEDLIKFGMVPEFIGRIPIIAALDELDVDALKRILVEPRNALMKQYKLEFSREGTEFMWDDDALSAIAGKALKKRTGARGLKTITEGVLLELLYKLPTLSRNKSAPKSFCLTREHVETGVIPIVPLGGQKLLAGPKK